MLKIVDSPPHCRPGNRARFHNCRLLAGNRVSQKYKRAQLRKIQRRECQKLKKLIPQIKGQEDVDQSTVIEEAIKYIDELHTALFQRFTQGAIPKHVIPEALPIIQLLQNGQLPLPEPLQQQQRQFLLQRQLQQLQLQQLQHQQQLQQQQPKHQQQPHQDSENIPPQCSRVQSFPQRHTQQQCLNTVPSSIPSCSMGPNFPAPRRMALQDIQNVQYAKPSGSSKGVSRGQYKQQ